MTAGQQASANFGGVSGYSMSVGTSGGGTNGFLDGSYGSLSPNNLFKTTTINTLASDNNNPGQLRFFLVGTFPQAYFTSITVQKTDGTVQTFLASAASITQSGGLTRWFWNGVAGGIWTSTSPSPRTISFAL